MITKKYDQLLKKLIILILFFYVISGIFLLAHKKGEERETIIILNGPSSSGKSSIAKKIEEKFEGQYLKIGADEYSLMLLPERFINYKPDIKQPADSRALIFVRADDEKGPKLITKVGSFAKKVFLSMPTVIAALAKEGNNIIVDAGVTSNIEWLKSFVTTLRPFRAYLIKITTPLAVTEQREKERHGLIGLSRGQSEDMKTIEETYDIKFDLCIDTSTITVEKAAENIIDFIQKNPQPKAFKKIKLN